MTDKKLPELIEDLGRDSGEGWSRTYRHYRHGIREFSRTEMTYDRATDEGHRKFLMNMEQPLTHLAIEDFLQGLLTAYDLPPFEADDDPLTDDYPPGSQHPGFTRFENAAHPVRLALEALGFLVLSRRARRVADMLVGDARESTLEIAIGWATSAASLAGELITTLAFEREALVGERVVEGGRKSADLSRQRRGTPTTEERLKAWREAWAGDTGAKWGRRKRVAKKLCKLFGTTEKSEIKFFSRNRDHIVNG